MLLLLSYNPERGKSGLRFSFKLTPVLSCLSKWLDVNLSPPQAWDFLWFASTSTVASFFQPFKQLIKVKTFKSA